MYLIISKQDCKFCRMAVHLLKENNIEFIYKENTDYPIDTIEGLKKTYQIKTYPMIFKGDVYLGGYNELYKDIFSLT